MPRNATPGHTQRAPIDDPTADAAAAAAGAQSKRQGSTDQTKRRGGVATPDDRIPWIQPTSDPTATTTAKSTAVARWVRSASGASPDTTPAPAEGSRTEAEPGNGAEPEGLPVVEPEPPAPDPGVTIDPRHDAAP